MARASTSPLQASSSKHSARVHPNAQGCAASHLRYSAGTSANGVPAYLPNLKTTHDATGAFSPRPHTVRGHVHSVGRCPGPVSLPVNQPAGSPGPPECPTPAGPHSVRNGRRHKQQKQRDWFWPLVRFTSSMPGKRPPWKGGEMPGLASRSQSGENARIGREESSRFGPVLGLGPNDPVDPDTSPPSGAGFLPNLPNDP